MSKTADNAERDLSALIEAVTKLYPSHVFRVRTVDLAPIVASVALQDRTVGYLRWNEHAAWWTLHDANLAPVTNAYAEARNHGSPGTALQALLTDHAGHLAADAGRLTTDSLRPDYLPEDREHNAVEARLTYARVLSCLDAIASVRELVIQQRTAPIVTPQSADSYAAGEYQKCSVCKLYPINHPSGMCATCQPEATPQTADPAAKD